MRKVTVIGHFGGGKEFFDGQTIKTKAITNQLKKKYGDNEVVIYDTYGGINFLLKMPFIVIVSLIKTKNIVVLPGQNGLKCIAPILVMANLFFKRSLHYCVIGGWLPSLIENKKYLFSIIKKFDGVYVETLTMKTKLELLGLDNTVVMPNFKQLKSLKMDEVRDYGEKPYKLCTFSRVMKEKGIEDAVDAIIAYNTSKEEAVFTLDIYGQIDPEQKSWFETLSRKFPKYIRYAGIVPFNKSVEVIKDYFALLFPTYYEGEGFAGTLIDSMSAGVPVIATDWKYNKEIVNTNNGLLYQVRSQKALTDSLEKAINVFNLELRKKCIKEYEKYQPESVIEILTGKFED